MKLKQIISFVMAVLVLAAQPIAAKDTATSYNFSRALDEAQNFGH